MWWAQEGVPKSTRLCQELDAQLTKHALSSAPDAQLLETPLDRFARAERAHQRQFKAVAERRTTVQERQAQRQAKIDAWHSRAHSPRSPSTRSQSFLSSAPLQASSVSDAAIYAAVAVATR